MKSELEPIVKEALAEIGLELFELRRGGTRNRPVVDVRIDRTGGQNISIEDCARASRAIEAKLDVDEDGQRYVLEVSSPGVERPLRDAADWARFVGKKANVKSDLLGGMAEVEIMGIEHEDWREIAVMRTAKGEELRLPLNEVREARLSFNWNR
ncbi:MAG: ribosome maturation factor RimP [Gemmatimonadaceae bacterium]